MRIFSNWNPADEQLPDEITWNPLASRDKHKKSDSKIDIAEVFEAHKFFSQTDVIQKTPLMHSSSLSA